MQHNSTMGSINRFGGGGGPPSFDGGSHGICWK